MPPTPPLPPTPDLILAEARNLVLDAVSQIAPGKPKVYRAQTLTIRGMHKAPETDVWLIAERIVAENAWVDVSGRDGTPSYTAADRAQDGSTPGQDGRHGDQSGRNPAGKGGNAGRLTLVCRQLSGSLNLVANGGRGGNGLGGGNGVKGAVGARGQSRVYSPGAAVGGVGGKGGRSGDGGTGGDGGDAGVIWTAIEDAIGANLISTALAGQPGLGGKAGAPGAGGDGGPGGAWGYNEPASRF